MRKLSILAACLLVASCEDQKKAAEAPPKPVETKTAAQPAPTPTNEASAEAIKKSIAELEGGWATLDAAKVAGAYAEDGVIDMVGAPEVSGRSAIQEMLAGLFAGSKDQKVPFTRKFMAGNIMIGEWVWAGTHTGNLMGVPATEKTFGLRGTSVYEFGPDGSIKRATAYFDIPTLMSQLGASKEPARPVEALPTEAAVEIASTNSEAEQRNIEAVKKMLGTLEKKDEAAFLASFKDDVIWEDYTQPKAMKGKETAKQFFEMFTAAFPDIKITPQNIWAFGNYVVHENTLTGTHKGALGPIKPTNKQVNLHGVDIVELDDKGMIVRGWTYTNNAELLMQLGLMPLPGEAKEAKEPTAAK